MNKLINSQVARYLLVGAANTAFSYSIYATGIYFGLSYQIASLIGLIIGIGFSFKTQGLLVFKNGDNKLIYKFIINWVFLYICMILFIKIFIDIGFSQYTAGMISLLPSTALSFFTQKFWVFKKKNSIPTLLPTYFYVKNFRHFARRILVANGFGRVKLGEYSYGTPTLRWWGEEANISIGKFCSIGKNVTIFLGGNHRSDWVSTYPFPAFAPWKTAQKINGYSVTRGDVIIGNDVWIGEGSVILSGVQIGDGVIIGCNSVISKDIPDYSVVAGNPAKFIRKRFQDAEIQALKDLKWWDWDKRKIDSVLPEMLSENIADFIRKYSTTKINFF